MKGMPCSSFYYHVYDEFSLVVTIWCCVEIESVSWKTFTKILDQSIAIDSWIRIIVKVWRWRLYLLKLSHISSNIVICGTDLLKFLGQARESFYIASIRWQQRSSSCRCNFLFFSFQIFLQFLVFLSHEIQLTTEVFDFCL